MVRFSHLAASLPLLSVSFASVVARQDAGSSVAAVSSVLMATQTGSADAGDDETDDNDDVWDGDVASVSLPVPTGFTSFDISQPVTVTLVDVNGTNPQTVVFSGEAPSATSASDVVTTTSSAAAPSKTTDDSPSKSSDRWPQGTPTVICSNEEDYPDRVYKNKLDNFEIDRPRWAELKSMSELIKEVATAACHKANTIENVPKDSFIITDDNKFNYRAITFETDLVASVHVPNGTYKFSTTECDDLTTRAINQCSGEGKNKFEAVISTIDDQFTIKIGAPGDDINNSAANPLPFATMLSANWDTQSEGPLDWKMSGYKKVDTVILNPGTNDDYEGYMLKLSSCIGKWAGGNSKTEFMKGPFDSVKDEKAGVGPVYSIAHVYTNKCHKSNLDGYLNCLAGVEGIASPGYEKGPNGKDFKQFFCDVDNGLGEDVTKMYWPKGAC